MPDEWEKWPSNLPLEEQVKRLGQVLMDEYPDAFDRSEGAMEKAARLLWGNATHPDVRALDNDGSDG